MSQWLPIAELAAKVKIGELSATELVERALKTIRKKRNTTPLSLPPLSVPGSALPVLTRQLKTAKRLGV